MGEVVFDWGSFLPDDLVIRLLDVAMPFSVARKRSCSRLAVDVGWDSTWDAGWVSKVV